MLSRGARRPCAMHAALAVRNLKNFPFLFEGTETNEKENGGLRGQRPRDPSGLLSASIKSLTSTGLGRDESRISCPQS